jgi:hypothetical protein
MHTHILTSCSLMRCMRELSRRDGRRRAARPAPSCGVGGGRGAGPRAAPIGCGRAGVPHTHTHALCTSRHRGRRHRGRQQHDHQPAAHPGHHANPRAHAVSGPDARGRRRRFCRYCCRCCCCCCGGWGGRRCTEYTAAARGWLEGRAGGGQAGGRPLVGVCALSRAGQYGARTSRTHMHAHAHARGHTCTHAQTRTHTCTCTHKHAPHRRIHTGTHIANDLALCMWVGGQDAPGAQPSTAHVRCGVCGRQPVPEVVLCTIEAPPELSVRRWSKGHTRHPSVRARVCVCVCVFVCVFEFLLSSLQPSPCFFQSLCM